MIPGKQVEVEGSSLPTDAEVVSVHEDESIRFKILRSWFGRPYTRNDKEVEASPISWPFTLSGSVLTLGSITFIFTVIIVTIVACDNNGSCNAESGWPVEVWGERKKDDWIHLCEESNEENFLAQKSNSLSCFSFMIAGTMVLSCSIADFLRRCYRKKHILNCVSDIENGSRINKSEYILRNHVTDWPAFSILYALGLMWGGIASFSMHSHPTALTGALDMGSIWWMLNPLIVFTAILFTRAASRYRHRFRRAAEVTIVSLNVLFTWLVFEDRIEEDIKALQVAVGVLVSSLFVLGCLRTFKMFQKPASTIWGNETNWRLKTNGFLAGFGTCLIFVIAYLLEWEVITVECTSTSWFQPHAAFHSLCATGFLSVYLTLFRSEDFSFSMSQSDYQDSKIKKEKSAAHVEASG
mmetsp:Transcript_90/g.76  ORF Transcript_90/g.76 Transcript_90/m.76 type:complete len:410 (+) Transcript_90:104-1333(+)